ncbi:unnamed protein product [Cylindrotheca closterium]|uniref:Uncharacterized protein n=1 Tax=Cylindrotheca closterium TaxID=2856 RepID=A0AAD2G0G3_9STRA|nr:unnamed protein product [Cylindrotheca closterium]
MDLIIDLLNEYPIGCNALFFSLAVLFLRLNEDGFRRDRRRNHLRAYRRDGVLCGGVVIDRKIVANKHLVRYAYRLPQHDDDAAYIKDFVEAPNELKEDHKNIIVVLFPKRPTSGIHYGLLQKLWYSKDVERNHGAAPGIAHKAFLRLCLLQGVMVLWASLGRHFFWTCQLLLYVGLFQLYRVNKTEEEATGVTGGVYKTLKRNEPDAWYWSAAPMLEPLTSNDEQPHDTTSTEDVFVALEKSERMLGQIMNSFDPESEQQRQQQQQDGGNKVSFPCEMYFSLLPRCQQALQKGTVLFDT